MSLILELMMFQVAEDIQVRNLRSLFVYHAYSLNVASFKEKLGTLNTLVATSYQEFKLFYSYYIL